MNWRHGEFVSSLKSITETSPLSEEREALVREHLVDRVLNDDYPNLDLNVQISGALDATPDDITIITDHFEIDSTSIAELEGGGYIVTVEALSSETLLLDYDDPRPPRPTDYVECIVTFTLAAKLKGVEEIVDADIHVFPGNVQDYKDAKAQFEPEDVF